MYHLLLMTFLVYPVIALALKHSLGDVKKFFKNTLSLVILLLLHNLLFAAGYSIKGDFADYVIFSLEYFIFCIFIVSSYQSSYSFTPALRVFGTMALVAGALVGLWGTIFFAVITQDYEADHLFSFQVTEKQYQTRRYSLGFATLADTKYTFETYRQYKAVPFERKIDKTVFLGIQTPLKIHEKTLRITIDQQTLIFTSTHGEVFSKKLKR